jgi:predicted peroxiredoxin
MLLSSGAKQEDLAAAAGIAEAALKSGAEVYLYLIDEGVRHVGAEALQRLRGQGLKLFACAFGGQQFGVPVSDQATFGGLVILSDIIEGCDRFISLG